MSAVTSTGSDGVGVASLPMYPFAALRDATERYWQRVVKQLPDLPPLAPWGPDVHALWSDPNLCLSQTCGWPLVTELEGRVAVVGAFTYQVDEIAGIGAPAWTGAHYRSVIVARDGTTTGLDELLGGRLRAAVNNADSLSGWISLTAWLNEQTANSARAADNPAGDWPGPVLWTGAHIDSLRALQAQRADIASIDAVSIAHVARLDAGLLSGLTVVGSGPLVPTLPVITSVTTSTQRVDELRAALRDAVDDLVRESLMIDGFADFDASAYDGVRAVSNRRRQP